MINASHGSPPLQQHKSCSFFILFFPSRCNNFIFKSSPRQGNCGEKQHLKPASSRKVKHVEELGDERAVSSRIFVLRSLCIYIIYVLKRSCSRHMLVKRLIDINSRRETAIQVTVTKELEESKILQFFSSQHLPNSCYLLNQRMTPKVFMYIAMTWLRSWETSDTKMPRQAGH